MLFFAWRFPKAPTVTAGAASSRGDQALALRPYGDHHARGYGRISPVSDGDGQRAVRHYLAIHYLFPFSLFAALALSSLAAQRVNEDQFAPRFALT